jgi:hypothetical protein
MLMKLTPVDHNKFRSLFVILEASLKKTSLRQSSQQFRCTFTILMEQITIVVTAVAIR